MNDIAIYGAGGYGREIACLINNKINSEVKEWNLVGFFDDDESLRDVELASTTVPNWDTYDTVFIGYPIWWGIAAWPTDGFVKANDFTGKTVIPFCTSASSEIGDSGKLLEEEAGTGNWLDGMRFRSSASEDDVKSWVDGLEK